MSDRLVKDYGCGQVRQNDNHVYCTGEHWLFSKIDSGMSVADARADHDDDWGGYGNADALAQAEQYAIGSPYSIGWWYRHFKHGG